VNTLAADQMDSVDSCCCYRAFCNLLLLLLLLTSICLQSHRTTVGSA